MGIQEDLKKLAGIADPTTRRLAFLALFSEEYRRRNGGRYPVLVGGMAVELYTQGHYSTRDVDLLCKDERAWEILQEWGFERLPAKRQFYSENLDIALEILGDKLVNEDPDAEARTEFVLFEGLGEESPNRIRVIALEDLVLDRLNAALHWNSPEDRLWAEIMLELGLSSDSLNLNLDYLKRKAGEKGYETGELLEEILSKIESEGKGGGSGGDPV
jgi:hypothetical protein